MEGLYVIDVTDPSINFGAQVKALARTVGMSDGDANRAIQVIQMKGRKKLGRDISAQEAHQILLRRFQKVQAVNDEMPADIDQLLTIPNEKVQFGEDGNQDELQNFGGLDKNGRIKNLGQAAEEKEKVKQKRGADVFLRRKMVGRDKDNKKQYDMEEVFVPQGQAVPDEFRDQAILRDFGLRIAGRDSNGDEIVVPFREEVAPANIILGQEAARIQEGIDKFGADAFPGAATLVDDIRDNLRPTPEAERALARDAVMADARGLSAEAIEQEAERRLRLEFEPVFETEPRIGRRGIDAAMPIDAREVRKAEIMSALGGFTPQGRQDMIEANDWKANAEAQKIAQSKFGLNGPGAQADADIARIQQIQKIGHAKIGDDFNVVKQMPGRQVDPKALPIDFNQQYNIATEVPIDGSLNVQQQWLADNAPGFREDGRIFGDFPQVAINQELNNAEQALRNIKIKGKQVNPDLIQIRNIDGLQAAVDNIINLGIANRQGFFDRVDGKNVNNPNPGIRQVLNKARMNDNQQGNLARAMMMQELAGNERRNIEGDSRMATGVDFNNGAPVARINREKIEGREIKAALQALDGRRADPPLNVQELAQARMPFQAGIAGQDIPRAAFVRGADRHLNREGLVRKHGAVNGNRAADIIDRREMQAGKSADGFGIRGDFNVVPAPEMARVQIPTARATSAVVNPVSQTSPEMGNGGLPPQPPAVATAAAGPEPEKYQRMGFKFRPDGASRGDRNRREVIKHLERGRTQRRTGAAVGGAIAGLVGINGLIGNERNKREEEQYA